MLDVRDGYYGETAVAFIEKAQDETSIAKVKALTDFAQVYATLELAVQTNRLRP